jgi:hypothetical protein
MLHVLLAERQLGLGASGVGYLAGAIGLGALAAMPFSTSFVDSDRPARLLSLSLVLNAFPLAILAAVHAPVFAAALLFVQGFSLVAFEVVTITLVQRLNPVTGLGRAFGQINAASNAGRLVGVLATLAAVDGLGLDTSLVVLGSLVFAATVVTLPGLAELGQRSLGQRRTLQPIVDVLAASALFEGVSVSSLERLASSVQTVRHGSGDVVIREGEEADALYLARSGSFSVSADGAIINSMGGGDWFGEIGLIHRRPRTATVTVTSPAELWLVPGGDFLDCLADAAAPPAAMLDSIAQRMARSGHDR